LVRVGDFSERSLVPAISVYDTFLCVLVLCTQVNMCASVTRILL
jgi:hypothetical protein